jgi:hypothetical protein
LPEDSYSARLTQELLERLAVEEYREAAQSIEHTGNTISFKQAGRIAERVGTDLRSQQYGSEAQVHASEQASKNPPSTMLILADGAKHRTNEADRRAGKAGDGDADASTKSKDDTAQSDRGWREHKVGLVTRLETGQVGADGNWDRPPEEQVKTYVATTETIESFGHDLKTEAERRGEADAGKVVFLSDNGHGIPQMRQREFPKAEVITDFNHTDDRLSEAAEILEGKGETFAEARKKTYSTLRTLLWDGHTKTLVEKLVTLATPLAPRPDRLSDLKDRPDARNLWEHIFYLERWQHTMKYPEYRAQGWPIGSGSVESACGQFGDRIKHARMRWSTHVLEALLMIIADIHSQDGRWKDRWPPPIPVLELPCLSIRKSA